MTYQEIVNRIQSIVDAHYQLADFGYGDLSDLKTRFENTSGDSAVQADYPYLFLNPGVHTRNLNTMTYNFNMIVMDMARGEVADQPYNNILAIQSQCQQMIDDVLATLYYGFKDQPEIMRANMSYTPFNERFQDDVAGMTASLSIEVPTSLNYCIAPVEKTTFLAEATNSIQYLLGPDFGEDTAFTYNIEVYDPSNLWDLNRFQISEPGSYKITEAQTITLNEPAPGETIPQTPKVIQYPPVGAAVAIPPVSSYGWPTEWVSDSQEYEWTATYFVNVSQSGTTLQFLMLQDQPGLESSLYQKIGGVIKLYRIDNL